MLIIHHRRRRRRRVLATLRSLRFTHSHCSHSAICTSARATRRLLTLYTAPDVITLPGRNIAPFSTVAFIGLVVMPGTYLHVWSAGHISLLKL